MSTTLLNCEVALSKEIADYWDSTTTSSGSTTTLIDTALIAKSSDWITPESYDMITSGTYGTVGGQQERKIVSLNTTGTMTVLAHGGTIGSSVTYRVHRLFDASEKRRALIAAAKNIFPFCFKEVRDESLVSGNWLKDGSFERWTTSAALTDWTVTDSTVGQTNTPYYFKHGSYGCKISGDAGNVKQSVTNYDDLKRLAGKSVTSTLQGWSDTASCLRIGIYDGTTYTYSSYHDGSDTWTKDSAPMTVSATISNHPSVIEFIAFQDIASHNSYIDDARLIGGDNGKIYIGNLGLAQNKPHQVLVEPSDYYTGEPWKLIRDITYDTTNGYMFLPYWVNPDLRLRVLGTGYLDFLASGASATTWEATIALDEPQVKILTAEAAVYLYSQMAIPNYETGTRTDYQKALAYWKNEAVERKAKFGMKSPPATVNWGSG